MRRPAAALFAGKVGVFNRTRQLTHPDFRMLGDAADDAGRGEIEEFAGALIPVYPATGGRADLEDRHAACGLVLDRSTPPADPLPADAARPAPADRPRRGAARASTGRRRRATRARRGSG